MQLSRDRDKSRCKGGDHSWPKLSRAPDAGPEGVVPTEQGQRACHKHLHVRGVVEHVLGRYDMW